MTSLFSGGQTSQHSSLPVSQPVSTPVSQSIGAPAVGTVITGVEKPAPVTAPLAPMPVTAPVQTPVKVDHTAKPVSLDTIAATQSPGTAFSPNAGGSFYGTTAAIFAAEAAPPNPPTSANVVVGQVVDSTGKIVDGAILEVREAGGPPVRALRTNKIGHFMTVTPLRDGEYEIEIEKDGLQFDNIKILASGSIIPPIMIKAK